MHPDLDKVLITEQEVQKRIRELGEQISCDYAGKEILVVGILKGAAVFLADLVRYISIPVYFDFMAVSSYGAGSASSGVVRILKDLDRPIEGRHVIIVEDIVDTGLTLNYLVQSLQSRNPASLKVCTLLDKPERRVAKVKVDYNGFDIPDQFVVGYGLDYNERYRNFPYIGVLKRSVYT
ncbi:hypoxanthine phosphoribosyltransferase [Desulfofarcimen acetoxidans DSM 771]|jgi:hypoxanthine phosphoribosyltransferase|uniref:Hypoxanthine phosphoribosyltransferase n=1 Tax=Desulfofarcimen acetoxidans (strain ATCC 49208 / DSM 771 / KCTC 5769 / VKM B-1644 / 5575) TaxID=485916 RepID=C8W1J2_DESAS|nr:hypoxanthine phosphoribosyltransferase [Desulfofarcimen acetoxidans]ACV61637.1 hypoxanthine phosphoribosyltransferase [Desulfofarcimen acetoxidans DSM 771]